MFVRCDHCQHEAPFHSRFCNQCGAEITSLLNRQDRIDLDAHLKSDAYEATKEAARQQRELSRKHLIATIHEERAREIMSLGKVALGLTGLHSLLELFVFQKPSGLESFFGVLFASLFEGIGAMLFFYWLYFHVIHPFPDGELNAD